MTRMCAGAAQDRDAATTMGADLGDVAARAWMAQGCNLAQEDELPVPTT